VENNGSSSSAFILVLAQTLDKSFACVLFGGNVLDIELELVKVFEGLVGTSCRSVHPFDLGLDRLVRAGHIGHLTLLTRSVDNKDEDSAVDRGVEGKQMAGIGRGMVKVKVVENLVILEIGGLVLALGLEISKFKSFIQTTLGPIRDRANTAHVDDGSVQEWKLSLVDTFNVGMTKEARQVLGLFLVQVLGHGELVEMQTRVSSRKGADHFLLGE